MQGGLIVLDGSSLAGQTTGAMSDRVRSIRNRAGHLLIIVDELDDGFLCIPPAGGEPRSYKSVQLELGDPDDRSLDDGEISAGQRQSFLRFEAGEADRAREREIDAVVSRPRSGGGGVFAQGDEFDFPQLVERLHSWLVEKREATIGTGFGRSPYLYTNLSGIRFALHADVPASGVGEFLKFVERAGGAERVKVAGHQLGEPGSVSFTYDGLATSECPKGFYTTYLPT